MRTMHVLVATDGTLDPELTAPLVASLAGGGGRATVLSIIEINRNMLRDLRSLYGERSVERTDQDAEYVGLQPDSSSGVTADWPGDDQMLKRYMEDQTAQRTSSMVGALTIAGVTAEVVAREGEDAARAIITAIGELEVDVVCVGSHGRGLFEGVLGSTGTKLARRAPCPVLIIRS